MVQCDVEEIERVHPMPGNYWVVSFTTSDMAEEAQNGFILKEKRIHPVLMAKRFVTATVAYVPPDATLGDIEKALERCAEVISIKDLYVRDFPGIKDGKQRVVLKPREGKLPAFFQVGRYKASLFFSGRVACCPYCERTDHLGRDCTRKREKKCYKCGRIGHYQRNCPDLYQRYEDYVQQTRQEQNNNNEQDRKEMDSNEINGEQAAERDSTPSVSVDMAGVEELSDDESSDSSVDTLIEVPDNNNATATATTSTTPPTATKDAINIVTVNKETEEVLAGLFSPERPTRAESEQQRQETEDENTQVLFTDPESTPKDTQNTETTPDPESTPKDTQNTETTPKDTQEEMDTQQNLKRKPLAKVDLRLKLGQSPKPRRSPKHKRRNEKV